MKTAAPYTKAWLNYGPVDRSENTEYYSRILCAAQGGPILDNAVRELRTGAKGMYGIDPAVVPSKPAQGGYIELAVDPALDTVKEGYTIVSDDTRIRITGKEPVGALYGAFHVLRLTATGKSLKNLDIRKNPSARWRILNHWDMFLPMVAGNADGFLGRSLFFQNGEIVCNDRTRDYLRMLASVGINGLAMHNVNVYNDALDMILPRYYKEMTALSTLFASYGVGMVIALNFASPVLIGGLETADPRDARVQAWWNETMAKLYVNVPNIVGFVVKADSEGVQGPFDYGRTQADGANLIARAVAPYGGVVFWRCFVYNCQQDWRDTVTDRARSGYDNFHPLDGKFDDNVILQIKNGPQDFQVREPVHPLFGAMLHTHEMMELQIVQEYTGGTVHTCFLIPEFKEILDFNTYADGRDNTVADIVCGRAFGDYERAGIVAVANATACENWCGHDLACANLYGYGRLCFDTAATSEEIARDFIMQTYSMNPTVVENLTHILLHSWPTYEKYNSPLGLGWLCNNTMHYGPGPDIYEYDRWGTYHRANKNAIGVDRTSRGTGYVLEYNEPNRSMYDNLETCPENLKLFFYRLRYDYVLNSGKTVLQHIYDTHFEGVGDVEVFVKKWDELQGLVPDDVFARVQKKFAQQLEHSKEWRDVINTYFYRRTGIPDAYGRKIYE
ncbi:MAG: alpha-glucuronidase [Clostridia bacterium]|nr:alpha-glucuronidase [Clostridia bacterium]